MRRTRGVAATLGAVLVAVGWSSARADDEVDAATLQKNLEGYSSVIAELQKLPGQDLSADDVEKIRNLVSQGQAFLAAEKSEEIVPLLERADALAALVRARGARVEAEQRAEGAEAAANEAEATAAAARQAAEAAQKQFDELEAKGL